MDFLQFPQLNHPAIKHGFSLRDSKSPKWVRTFSDVLPSTSLSGHIIIEAEQPHGNLVKYVGDLRRQTTIPQVDSLITDKEGITLVIRTADCGPIFLFDPIRVAIGLVHSGRKGTEANIVQLTIRSMQTHFGSEPKDLVVVLGPCIRPPYYETNFADAIGHQAKDCGVVNYADCGENTAEDLKRFYSYRMEKGHTGRHFAYLQISTR
ncbi:MAG: polyphenol oxidase family protein [Verrucomicrobiota bacterium]